MGLLIGSPRSKFRTRLGDGPTGLIEAAFDMITGEENATGDVTKFPLRIWGNLVWGKDTANDKLYYCAPGASTSDDIYQRTFATAEDISSAVTNTASFRTSQNNVALGISIDGTQALAVAATGAVISLTMTAYDITTMAEDAGSTATAACLGACFSPLGDFMYLLTTTQIVEYSMSTPWDRTTLSATGDTYTHGITTPIGIACSSDGRQFYVGENISTANFFVVRRLRNGGAWALSSLVDGGIPETMLMVNQGNAGNRAFGFNETQDRFYSAGDAGSLRISQNTGKTVGEAALIGISASARWRLRINDNVSFNYVGLAECIYKDSGGSAISVASGTASASSDQGSFPASSAFDGSNVTKWVSASNSYVGSPTPQWIEYAFASTIDPYSCTLISTNNGVGADGPADFTFEYFDGEGWIEAAAFTGQTWVSNNQSQTFTIQV